MLFWGVFISQCHFSKAIFNQFHWFHTLSVSIVCWLLKQREAIGFFFQKNFFLLPLFRGQSCTSIFKSNDFCLILRANFFWMESFSITKLLSEKCYFADLYSYGARWWAKMEKKGNFQKKIFYLSAVHSLYIYFLTIIWISKGALYYRGCKKYKKV